MKYPNIPNPSLGRALAYEDIAALEALAIFPQTILRGMGECVVDACGLTNGYLGGGTVWLGNKLYEFPGGTLGSNQFLIPSVSYDPARPAPAALSGTVGGPRNEFAQLSPTPGNGPWVKVDVPEKTIRLAHRWQELTRAVGTVEWLAALPTGDYDNTGRGQNKALGWALCNGANNTIDLRARFVLGHNPSSNASPQGYLTANTFMQTGGDENVQLSEAQMPRHTHSIDYAGDHQHYTTSHGDRGSGGGGREPYSYNERDNSKTIYTNFAGNHTHSMQPTGGTDAHPNMPPYFVLAARQWIGL